MDDMHCSLDFSNLLHGNDELISALLNASSNADSIDLVEFLQLSQMPESFAAADLSMTSISIPLNIITKL
jgi:hypothetical protein